MYACTVMTHMSSWFGVMFRLGSSKSLSSEKICPEDNPTGIIIIIIIIIIIMLVLSLFIKIIIIIIIIY